MRWQPTRIEESDLVLDLRAGVPDVLSEQLAIRLYNRGMNELSPREWISAKEAARILKVSERQINYYGRDGRIRIQRAGRRVLYNLEDVNRLAQTLAVDIRPQHITRSDVNEQLARYVQDRAQRDDEFSEVQKRMADEQRQTNERLARIEKHLATPQATPRGPNWQTITIALIVLAIALIVLAILVRLF